MSTIERQVFDDWRSKPAGETFELINAVAINEALFTRVCRAITAFLNTSGGTIVVALPRDAFLPELADRVSLGIDMEIVPRPNIDVSMVSVEPEKNDFRTMEIVVIDIPVGYERPYSYKSQILIRKGESIQLANRQEILTLLGEHEDPETRWERQLLPAASEADLNAERIHECLKRDDIVHAVQGWRPSAEDSPTWALLRYFNLGRRPSLRNSAIILFGRSPTNYFPQAAVRVVAYEAEESSARSIADEKTFSRSLFDNIEECLFFCERHIMFSSRFPTKDEKTFQRASEAGYPFAALREAILNALVHRDFTSFDTNVSIKIMPSRIEIWNPGSFPKGTNLENLEDFRISRPPNPDIAHVLQRMGFIERLGSGINRIIKLFEKHGLPRPIWEQVGGGVRVTLKTSPDRRNRVHLLVEKVVSELEDGEVLSRKRIAGISGLSADEAEFLIDDLCEIGVLHRVKPDLFMFRQFK